MTALSHKQSHDFAAARFHMVESQLRPNTVRDGRILDRMGILPRELFVPAAMNGLAYIDEDLQVSPGRYLLEPMVLARLIEAAGIGANDRVLDVAPATGYSTAVLAALAREVVAVEAESALHRQTMQNLKHLGLANAEAHMGAHAQGWKAKAPYNVILVNGGAEVIPESLLMQLDEGGRLVVVMRHYGPAGVSHTGEARLYEKNHGVISHRALFDANVKLLPGFEAVRKFTF